MKSAVIAACVACFSVMSFSQVLHLKCVMDDGKADVMLVVDVQNSLMRADGPALPLSVTDDVYSSVAAITRDFKTVRTVNRHTGQLMIGELYGSQVTSRRTGVCEKTKPKPAKL